MNFLKGMGCGLIAGACAGMAFAPGRLRRKRKISRAVKAMGQMIEDASSFMRF